MVDKQRKENIANGDEELNMEEHAALDQAMEEYNRGDVISHEELKKELGL